MADQGLGSPNMDPAKKKDIQSKGGQTPRSGTSTGSTNTTGRGSKEGQVKGGKHSHDNQYTA
jgi:hypothetical protein